MASDEEKTRRKEVLRAQRQQARDAVRESLPASPALMKALFDHLDTRLAADGCDDTLRFVIEFVSQHQLQQGAVISWLEERGGYCDCEALANGEPIVEGAVSDY